MDESITEKKYPIENLWIFKTFLNILFAIIILFFYLKFKFADADGFSGTETQIVLFVAMLIICLVLLANNLLQRAYFHFTIDESFLTLRQGFISKQQRHLPFGVIQNIIVKQDFLDKILGIATVIIENASQGGQFNSVSQKSFFSGFGSKKQNELQSIQEIGFSGNRISFPGLSLANAESLKILMLKKMKDNPIEDNQSGL